MMQEETAERLADTQEINSNCLGYILELHYAATYGRPAGPSQPEVLCPICEDRAAAVKLPCGHAHCSKCTLQWLHARIEDDDDDLMPGHATCPICRAPHSVSTIVQSVISSLQD